MLPTLSAHQLLSSIVGQAVALTLASRAAQLHVRNVLLAREGDPHRRHLDAAKGEHGAMVCQVGPAAPPFLPPALHSFPNEEPRFLRFLFASVFLFFSPPSFGGAADCVIASSMRSLAIPNCRMLTVANRAL